MPEPRPYKKNAAMRFTEEQVSLLLTVQDMVREEVHKLFNHQPSDNSIPK